jgi:hypothetical protein
MKVSTMSLAMKGDPTEVGVSPVGSKLVSVEATQVTNEV